EFPSGPGEARHRHRPAAAPHVGSAGGAGIRPLRRDDLGRSARRGRARDGGYGPRSQNREETMKLAIGIVAASVCVLAAAPSDAADKVRLMISQKMPWELFAPEHALAEGYYKDENLDVEISYASGGADTLQTIITGSQDIATGNGALGVVAAFAKGAPVKVIASSGRGTEDVFWYVPKDSPIK